MALVSSRYPFSFFFLDFAFIFFAYLIDIYIIDMLLIFFFFWFRLIMAVLLRLRLQCADYSFSWLIIVYQISLIMFFCTWFIVGVVCLALMDASDLTHLNIAFWLNISICCFDIVVHFCIIAIFAAIKRLLRLFHACGNMLLIYFFKDFLVLPQVFSSPIKLLYVWRLLWVMFFCF